MLPERSPDVPVPPPIRRALSLLALLAGALAGCGGDGSGGGSDGPPPPHLVLTAAERTELLDLHAAVRAGATPIPSPPLPALAWSQELEVAAQRWADGCTWGHTPNLGTLGMGQNLSAGWPASSWTLAGLFAGWADEAAFYDYASGTCAAGEVCGHYTQLVWRGTTSVGCGVATCPPSGSFTQPWSYLVCNYAPPGNRVGEKPY
jgi:hypothetical protein